ncbi:hypothetical protein ACI51Z_09275 [Pectobacterium carotovorum]|uniref:Transposase n=1 Tax=Pectobacterium actinidiae TaxID=1507808 RepID=A0ABW8G8J5_9GAMM
MFVPSGVIEPAEWDIITAIPRSSSNVNLHPLTLTQWFYAYLPELAEAG